MKIVTLLYERNCVMKKIISLALVCVMLVGAVFALSSCGKFDSTPEETAAALSEEGYEVSVNQAPADCKVYIYASYNNVNEKTFEEIEIYYFESEGDAEAAFGAMSEKFDAKIAEQDKDYKREYGISGDVIYYGTKAAIKAAK